VSVKSALFKYSSRNTGIKRKREIKERKNERPEKITEKEVLSWCKAKGFDVSVVESKAVYSRGAGRYLRGQTEAGFADIAGCTDDGTAAFIELKARGKLKTIRPAQILFLERKARLGAFACCVDSASLIDGIFVLWTQHRDVSREHGINFLLGILKDMDRKKIIEEKDESFIP
jgi:hypothetical protein